MPDKAVPADLQDRHPHHDLRHRPAHRPPVRRPVHRGLRGLVQRGQGHGRAGAPRRPASATSGRPRPRSTRALFPHIQWERDYRTDSGGPGQWRGLCGSHWVKEVRVAGQGLHLRRRHEVPDAGHRRRQAGRAQPAGHPGQPRRPLRGGAHRQLGADGGGRHASSTTTAGAAAGAIRSTATRRPCSTTCSTST